MSGSTASNTSPTTSHSHDLCGWARDVTISGVRVAAFWVAILAPLAYIPALLETFGGQQTGLFLTLLVVQIACVVIGHDYSPSSR